MRYAEAGMHVLVPVYDDSGQLLLGKGANLTENHLDGLDKRGILELIVEDPRLMDVFVSPLIPPEIEAEGVRALRRLAEELIAEREGRLIRPKDGRIAGLVDIRKVSKAMSGHISNSIMGEPNLSGYAVSGGMNFTHPVRVALVSMLMGHIMGYSEMELVKLGEAAMLQNIGYLLISPDILRKIDQLTEAEEQEFRKHPQYSIDIVSRYQGISPEVSETILQHHERWDGSGYPQKKKGWDISPFAQLVAITDTYYTLISSTITRKAYSQSDAFEFIMSFSGELFDPDLVQIFAKHIPMYPTGAMVKLQTGEIGVVSETNTGYVGRPTVRVFQELNPRDNTLMVAEPLYDMDMTTSTYQYKIVERIV